MANPAYELAVRLGTVVHLLSRSKRYAEDPAERAMAVERRRPLLGLDLPEGRPVFWLHAVSMGEVGVAAVLVREIKKQMPEAIAVVSTATATGLESAQKKITDADAVVAARFDIRNLVATMFDAIRPTAIILVEGDLWRNMLAIARRRGVPVFVANAKMSEKSLAFYRRFPVYTHAMLSRLTRVYSQTGVYEQRFRELGIEPDKSEVAGNVKLDIDPPAVSAAELGEIAKIAGCAGASPIVTFGSIHPGEEIVAMRGMERVWQTHPGAHCLLVPRHIEKTPILADHIAREFGRSCRLYSQPDAAVDSPITLVDEMGLLMKLYALADIGVVGGTFIDGVGGHNLTEPSFVGKPVLYGPHVYKQPGLHDLMTAYKAGVQVSADGFPNALAALLDNTGELDQFGKNGERMVADARGVAARVVADILARTTVSKG